MVLKRLSAGIVLLWLLSSLLSVYSPAAGRVYAAEGSRPVPGWSFFNSGASQAEYQIDAADYSDGYQSLRLSSPTPKSPNVYLTGYQTVKVQPNTKYEWTVSVKGQNVKSGGVWFGGGVSSWNVRKAVPAGTYDWQDLTVSYETGANETSFTFRVVIEDHADAVWFDQIRMREGGKSVPLLSNPGFDQQVQPLLQEGFGQPLVWTAPPSPAGTVTSGPFGSGEGREAAAVTYTPAQGTNGWLNEVWNFPAKDLSGAAVVTLDVYAASQTASAKEPLALKIAGPAGTVLESQLPQLTAGQWNTVHLDLSAAPAAAKAQVTQISLYVKSTSPELEGRPSVTYAFDHISIGSSPVTLAPWESFRQSIAELNHAVAVPAGNLTIDGSLEDWTAYPRIALPSDYSLTKYPASDPHSGANDLSAEVYLAYDEQNLYWAAKVRDDEHVPRSGTNLWKGDSVQMAFGGGGAYGPEVGINNKNNIAEVVFLQPGRGPKGAEAITAKTQRIGQHTFYEVKMPWETIYASMPANAQTPFSVLINDSDTVTTSDTEDPKRGYIEWSPDSIGSRKNPWAMAPLYLLPKDSQQWTFWGGRTRKADYRAQPGLSSLCREPGGSAGNLRAALRVPRPAGFLHRTRPFDRGEAAGCDLQAQGRQ